MVKVPLEIISIKEESDALIVKLGGSFSDYSSADQPIWSQIQERVGKNQRSKTVFDLTAMEKNEATFSAVPKCVTMPKKGGVLIVAPEDWVYIIIASMKGDMAYGPTHQRR